MTNTWNRLTTALRRPVDSASLGVFRIAFGATMCVALLRFLAKGYFEAQLIAPKLMFPYPGLGFVQRGPAWAMYTLLVVITLAALCMALGLFTRVACVTFLVGFTYLELLDRSSYLNHYYLVSCLSFLLCLLPAGARFSLDVQLGRTQPLARMPGLFLYALRTQVAVVYGFAGVAKFDADWLFRAQPLRSWLFAHSHLPGLGALAQPVVAYLASWAGALFDLTVVPLLLLPPTRRAAFCALVLFHGSTGLLLPIGMFPWIMTGAATLLLPPDWPLRWLRARPVSPAPPASPARWRVALLCAHCALQLLLPVYQHLLHPDAAWSYRGFNFVWKVMLVEKSGTLRFRVHDPHGQRSWQVSPRVYLTALQERAVAVDPSLIEQLAVSIAERTRRMLGRPVAIYADSYAALNGRPVQPLVDPDVDIAGGAPEGWILPLAR